MKKYVRFNESVIEYPTYSYNEYDRSSITHVLYRRARNEISIDEFKAIHVMLDLYKLYDMPVHCDSLKNNNYSILKKN